MKKVALFVGILVTIIALTVGGINYYSVYQADKYNDRVIPYLEQLIPEISTWQEDVISKRLAFRARKKIDPDKFAAIIAEFSKLGKLQSFETPKFEQVMRGMTEKEEMYGDEDDLKTLLTYTSDAVYEHGDANITFVLAVRDEHLDLYYFNIKSNALLRRPGS